VVEEQEQFIELASSEFLLQQLRNLLASGAQERLDALPDGIHSGLIRSNERGLFFYFTAPDPSDANGVQHYWRYYDLQTRQIQDNRFIIGNLIACAPDTPRVLGEANVFEIQEKIKDHILESVTEKIAAEAAPAIIEPIQKTVSAVFMESLSRPDLERSRVLEAIKGLQQPMMGVSLRRLKAAYQDYQLGKDIETLLASVVGLSQALPSEEEEDRGNQHLRPITRDNLHLVCWEYVWS
jgi:hypothetical protein